MKGKLLVVEDDPAVSELIQETLCSAQLGLRRAFSGEDALVLIGAESFDAAMIDLGLPGMGGIALHRRLATIDRSLAGRTLFMSAGTLAREDRDYIRSQAADRFLPKPFAADRLRIELSRLLAD